MEKVERRGDGLEALQEILTALAAEEAQSLRAIVSLYLELSLEKLRGRDWGILFEISGDGASGDGWDRWLVDIDCLILKNQPPFIFFTYIIGMNFYSFLFLFLFLLL